MGHTTNVRGKGKTLHRHIGSHGHTPDPRSLLSMQTRLAGFLGCYPLLTPLRTGWPSAWLCPVWQAFDQSGRTSTGPASWTYYHLHQGVANINFWYERIFKYIYIQKTIRMNIRIYSYKNHTNMIRTNIRISKYLSHPGTELVQIFNSKILILYYLKLLV